MKTEAEMESDYDQIDWFHCRMGLLWKRKRANGQRCNDENPKWNPVEVGRRKKNNDMALRLHRVFMSKENALRWSSAFTGVGLFEGRFAFGAMPAHGRRPLERGDVARGEERKYSGRRPARPRKKKWLEKTGTTTRSGIGESRRKKKGTRAFRSRRAKYLPRKHSRGSRKRRRPRVSDRKYSGTRPALTLKTHSNPIKKPKVKQKGTGQNRQWGNQRDGCVAQKKETQERFVLKSKNPVKTDSINPQKWAAATG